MKVASCGQSLRRSVLHRGAYSSLRRLWTKGYRMNVNFAWPEVPLPHGQRNAPLVGRAVALILGSCFVIYIVVRADPRTFFNLVLVAFAIFIAVNIATVAAGAGIAGGGNYAGAWEGITGNKNNFGRTVALAVLLLPMAAAVGSFNGTSPPGRARRSSIAWAGGGSTPRTTCASIT